MPDTKIISTAIKISHLTQLNTYVLRGQGKLVFFDETLSIPEFMQSAWLGDVNEFFGKMERTDLLYNFRNRWGLSYIGYSFLDADNKCTIIIGPYLETTLNPFQIARQNKLSNEEYEGLRNTFEKLKLLSPEQISSYAAVLQQFKAMAKSEINRVLIQDEFTGEALSGGKVDNEAPLVIERYWVEREFIHAVEQGKKELALELISSDNMLFYFSERFPNQPLRRLKNLAIVLNTILRLTVRNAHVPVTEIHQISEEFAYRIENMETVTALQQLQDEMIRTYCDLVRTTSLKQYSPLTQNVIEYLMSFYNQTIDKRGLAARCHAHPKHLSKVFKQDTGLTISAYQQKLRINEAKHLIRTENLPIEEIAWRVGYEDASYFARVFKKLTNYTPSAYRVKGRKE